ncbi:MAG: YbjN domain-containing protein [Gemmataceae bacterium]
MRIASLTLLLALHLPAYAADEKISERPEKAIKELTVPATESLLKSVGVDFKKVDPKKPDEGVFFDFKRGTFDVRLYNFQGKDLMMDSVFRALPLEKLNDWNTRAKFSRACLHKDAKGPYATLESNLDIAGGVTETTVKNFVLGFEAELKSFDRFIGGASLGDDDLFQGAVAERLENVFKGQAILFKKQEIPQKKVAVYELTIGKIPIRLINFGGKDLILESKYAKIPAEAANQYNLDRKFVRVVNSSAKGSESTSLEAYLDCEAGTTEAILRRYILAYEEETREFADYVRQHADNKQASK